MMDATNAILHAMDVTNAILHDGISHRITIETPHQYSTSTTCPARGSLPCVSNRQVDPVAMVPWPGRGNGDDGVDAVSLPQKGVSKRCIKKGHVII